MPTPQPPVPQPLVNGNWHEYTNIRFRIQVPGIGLKFGVKSINYKSPLKPAKVYGTHPSPLGSTIGIEEPEGDVELYLEEANRLIQQLGNGYKLVRFQIAVSYGATALTTWTDTLNGCRIVDIEHGHAQGTEALTVKMPLDVLSITNANTEALPNPLTAVISL